MGSLLQNQQNTHEVPECLQLMNSILEESSTQLALFEVVQGSFQAWVG